MVQPTRSILHVITIARSTFHQQSEPSAARTSQRTTHQTMWYYNQRQYTEWAKSSMSFLVNITMSNTALISDAWDTQVSLAVLNMPSMEPRTTQLVSTFAFICQNLQQQDFVHFRGVLNILIYSIICLFYLRRNILWGFVKEPLWLLVEKRLSTPNDLYRWLRHCNHLVFEGRQSDPATRSVQSRRHKFHTRIARGRSPEIDTRPDSRLQTLPSPISHCRILASIPGWHFGKIRVGLEIWYNYVWIS